MSEGKVFYRCALGIDVRDVCATHSLAYQLCTCNNNAALLEDFYDSHMAVLCKCANLLKQFPAASEWIPYFVSFDTLFSLHAELDDMSIAVYMSLALAGRRPYTCK